MRNSLWLGLAVLFCSLFTVSESQAQAFFSGSSCSPLETMVITNNSNCELMVHIEYEDGGTAAGINTIVPPGGTINFCYDFPTVLPISAEVSDPATGVGSHYEAPGYPGTSGGALVEDACSPSHEVLWTNNVVFGHFLGSSLVIQ